MTSTIADATRRTRAVVELGQQAVQATDLAALFELATSLVGHTLELPFAALFERAGEDQELVLRAGLGWREGQVGQTRVGGGSGSQARHTLECNEPVTVPDWSAETRFSGDPLLIRHGVQSGVTVVVPGHTRPFGVLGAYAGRPREFCSDEVHFLQAVAHILGAAVDRERAEAALRLSQRLGSVGRLVGGVAHDFNNLLTAITGYTDLVLGDLTSNDPHRGDIEEIRKAAERAATLTRRLLALSRRPITEPVPLDLNQVLPDEPEVPAEAAAGPDGSPRGSETVLLAEDDEAVRRLAQRILQQAGYEVLVAPNGTEGLEIGERHRGPIDLLISDVVMPRMGGPELARRLEALRPSLRVLYLSGYAGTDPAQQGLLERGAAFLPKPFTADSLIRIVRTLLDRPA